MKQIYSKPFVNRNESEQINFHIKCQKADFRSVERTRAHEVLCNITFTNISKATREKATELVNEFQKNLEEILTGECESPVS